MQDLWRLSATDIAALIRSKKISATEAASAALARLDAVNPKINAVVDHRPADVLAQAAAIDAAIARGDDVGPAGGRAGHRQGQYRPGRALPPPTASSCSATSLRRPTIRWSTICARPAPSFSGAPTARRFPIAGSPPTSFMATPKIRAIPASRRAARRAGQGRRWRPASATSRTAPISPDRSAIPPMPAACMACVRPSGGSRPSMPRCRSARSGRRSRAVSGPLARTIGDIRIALAAMSGLRFARPLVGAGAAAGAGDAEARRAVPQSRRARSGAGSEGRRRRCRQAAGARGMGGRGGRNAAAARGRRTADQTVARRWL